MSEPDKSRELLDVLNDLVVELHRHGEEMEKLRRTIAALCRLLNTPAKAGGVVGGVLGMLSKVGRRG